MTKRIILTLVTLVTLAVIAPVAAQAQTHTFTLNWTQPVAADKHDAPTGAKVERKLGVAGVFAEIAKLGPVTSYQDALPNPAPGGAQYCYRVRAFNALGDGPYSSEACGTTAVIIVPTVPGAPSGFTVSAISSSTLRITWDDLPNETAYEMWGKAAKGNQKYVLLARLAADSTTWDWNLRKSYTSYCVQARGTNAAGAGAFSLPLCATTSK